MKRRRKTGCGTNSNETLQKILRNLCDDQRRTGGGRTSNETLEKVLQSPQDESALVEKKMNNHKISKEVKKTLKKMLQPLHGESEEEENQGEKRDDNRTRSEEDIKQEIFEDVTLKERKRFYKLLNELKSRESNLKAEDFQNIDKLLPQYFKDEYEWKDADKLKRGNKSLSEQISQELRTFQRELPLISLEMQIILNFMDEKRNTIKDLLRIVESNNKDETLERKYTWRDILEDEYKQLKSDLSKDTIARVLSNRKFTPMNSEI